MKDSGRWVLTAKQAPDRPGIAPALGLRAGSDCIYIVPRTIYGG
jgi:hypothetical protein